jgi:hypothetical protein
VPPKQEKDGGLSDSDRAALDHARADMEEDKHRAWLWAAIGRVVKWLLAVIAFIVVVWDFVLRVLKSLGP